jgi:hypothetical protein
MNYGMAKRCMCEQHEDWRHILTCKSLDAEMIRADSWSKLKKQMDKWSFSSDMWLAMESDVRHYTMNPLKRDPENMPPQPSSPFGTTFDTPRNRLKVAFHAQSQIGWENFLKGRLSRDWIICMDGLSFSNKWEKTSWTGVHHKTYTRIVGTYGIEYGRIATTDIMIIPLNKLRDIKLKH